MAQSASPALLSAQDPAELLEPLAMLFELHEEAAAFHYVKRPGDCIESLFSLRVPKPRAGYGLGSSEPSARATG